MSVCRRVQEVEGVYSGSGMKARPSRILKHGKQATAVNRIGVNKIPPNFDTLCNPFMGLLLSLKGSLRVTFMGRSASKG